MPPRKQQVQQTRTSALAWAQQQEKGFEPTFLKLPMGFEMFEPEAGSTYTFDILRYVVGKGNPRAQKGELHFEREFLQHRLVSLSGKFDRYVCLTSFGKPCPVCQRFNRPHPSDDPDQIKKWKTSLRHLWVVRNLTAKDKPILVYETPHWKGFGEMLCDALGCNPDYEKFAEFKDGLSLRVAYKEATWENGSFTAVSRIDFVPREEDYDESILDRLPCLDECLIEKSYDELKAVLEQRSIEESVHKESTGRAAVAATSNGDHNNDDDDLRAGDLVMHKKLGKCEVVRVSSDEGTVSLKVLSSGQVRNGCDPDDCERTDDQPVPAPVTTRTAKAAPVVNSDDDDEPDLDFDDEDPPTSHTAGKRR